MKMFLEPPRSTEPVLCEFELHRVMGLMQHHDAVTGTEKQNVAEDYAMRLAAATARCHAETRDTLLAAAGLDPAALDLSATQCPRLNVSECEVSELGGRLVIMLVKSEKYFSGEKYLRPTFQYNPLSRPVTEYVRLPVIGTSYAVYDHRGQAVAAQLNPIPEHIRDIPGALIRFYIQHANKILWKYPYSQVFYTFSFMVRTVTPSQIQSNHILT